ncbi:MAG: penicillin-binding transpeptidase domain-containing protein [Chloroflexota bacterium]
MGPEIRRVHTAAMAAFLVIALALGYWQVFRSDEVLSRAGGDREHAGATRGAIVDRGGRPLAWSDTGGGGARRSAGPAVAAVTGYASARYGLTGLEERYDRELRGDAPISTWGRIAAEIGIGQVSSVNVVTTVDLRLQAEAAAALGDHAGSVVVMDPVTGEILALVSTPGFDPAAVEREWESLVRNEARPLVNRAIDSSYAPGSVFKIITAAAALDLGLVDPAARFRCTQPLILGSFVADCRNHAQLPLLNYREAFAWSSNRTFALTAIQLGRPALSLGDDALSGDTGAPGAIRSSGDRLEQYARRFGIGAAVSLDLHVQQATLKRSADWTPGLLAQTGIGQGEVVVTPLHVALAAAAVANRGMMPAPRLVLGLRDAAGRSVEVPPPGSSVRVVGSAAATALAEMMALGVQTGYGQRAQIPGVQVAGKTGTAETGTTGSPTHAWFAGYAPADRPRVAVAVIAERGGSGAEVAAPIAQRVLRRALEVTAPR